MMPETSNSPVLILLSPTGLNFPFSLAGKKGFEIPILPAAKGA
jgi:hypothetical protein